MENINEIKNNTKRLRISLAEAQALMEELAEKERIRLEALRALVRLDKMRALSQERKEGEKHGDT